MSTLDPGARGEGSGRQATNGVPALRRANGADVFAATLLFIAGMTLGVGVIGLIGRARDRSINFANDWTADPQPSQWWAVLGALVTLIAVVVHTVIHKRAAGRRRPLPVGPITLLFLGAAIGSFASGFLLPPASTVGTRTDHVLGATQQWGLDDWLAYTFIWWAPLLFLLIGMGGLLRARRKPADRDEPWVRPVQESPGGDADTLAAVEAPPAALMATPVIPVTRPSPWTMDQHGLPTPASGRRRPSRAYARVLNVREEQTMAVPETSVTCLGVEVRPDEGGDVFTSMLTVKFDQSSPQWAKFCYVGALIPVLYYSDYADEVILDPVALTTR